MRNVLLLSTCHQAIVSTVSRTPWGGAGCRTLWILIFDAEFREHCQVVQTVTMQIIWNHERNQFALYKCTAVTFLKLKLKLQLSLFVFVFYLLPCFCCCCLLFLPLSVLLYSLFCRKLTVITWMHTQYAQRTLLLTSSRANKTNFSVFAAANNSDSFLHKEQPSQLT